MPSTADLRLGRSHKGPRVPRHAAAVPRAARLWLAASLALWGLLGLEAWRLLG